MQQDSSPKIPENVSLEGAIAGYHAMSDIDQAHYRRLYTYACYPELMRGPVEGIGIDPDLIPVCSTDIHALVYFIFYHHVTYVVPHALLLLFSWNQAMGFQLRIGGSRLDQMLPTVSMLANIPVVYYTLFMLGLALLEWPDSATDDYRLLYQLARSLLQGDYTRQFKAIDQPMLSSLSCGWFLRRLPDPKKFDFSTILHHEKREQVESVLFGKEKNKPSVFEQPKFS